MSRNEVTDKWKKNRSSSEKMGCAESIVDAHSSMQTLPRFRANPLWSSLPPAAECFSTVAVVLELTSFCILRSIQ